MSWTFGRTTTTGYNGSASADNKYAGRFLNATAGDLQSLSAYVSVDAGGPAPTRFAIYTQSGADPGDLIAQTEAVSIPAGSGAHWRTLAFASPPALAASTYYFIAVHTSSSYLNIYRDDTGGLSNWSPDAYSDGFEATWGGSNSGTKYYCMYGTLTEANQAPTAPSNLSPSGGALVDVDQSQTVTWTSGDPDDGDTQSAYNHRYRIVGAGSWTETGWVNSPYSQKIYAGGTFVTGEDYEHQVQTKDNHGLEGPWCSSALFTGTSSPDAPTITDPANEATITTATYAMDWSTADQDAWQARRKNDVAGEPGDTIYEDTGTVEEPDTRTKTWTLAVNNRTEHWQVRVRHDALWGDYGSVEVDIAFTAPMTPTLVVSVDTENARIQLTPTQPTPTGDPLPPTVTGMDIYMTETDSKDDAIRIAADVSPSAIYNVYIVADYDADLDGPAYKFYVVAKAANGASAESELEG